MSPSNFSESLTELMLSKNISSQELANKLELSQTTVNRYKRGAELPTLETLISLANYFNCTTDYLLGIKLENTVKTFKSCPPFKERLPVLLKECKISQYRLEKDAKISHSVVGYWKSGKTQPTVESLYKISKALNCSIDFVIGRE